MARVLSSVALLLCLTMPTQAENWPGWRGPRGDGTSSDSRVPAEWDGATGHNVRWKVAIPGEGYSCPIVWDNQIFLGSCLPDTKERVLISLDRATGSPLWQKTILTGRLESKHALNSYASGTPATDGELVYIAFLEVDDKQVPAPNVGGKRLIHPGRMVVAAYDFAGNQKWIERPGDFVSAHGFCSNPVIYRDKVIVNGDHDGDSYIVALDKKTGKTLWKTPRRHKTRSYCTPLLREVDGQMQLVLCGSLCVASFNPDNGKPIWNSEGPTQQFVASVVYDGENFFAAGGFPTHHVVAIKPGGRGDVTKSHMSWETTQVKSYVPSPVLVGDYLLVADDRGTANCFNRKTGDRHWQTRMGKHFSASLLAVNGFAWFIADDGIVKLVKPGRKPEVVHTNKLGENTYSSPAIADGQVFIRGEKHLFCIAAED